jgi:hypothetical protein
MVLQKIPTSSLLLVAGVYGAAVLQHPLQADNPDLSYSDTAALAKLRDTVGIRLIDVEPIGKRCYPPAQLKDDQCDYYTGLRTNDTWTADQPGGYFYVR